MVTDKSINMSPSGRTNWIFVPLSEKNMAKAKILLDKPLPLRWAKMK